MANTFFYPPPDASETLYMPSGTALTILWTSSYENLNLRVFQENLDGTYTYNTLLSDVSTSPGNGSYAWGAHSLIIGVDSTGLHFEVTMASNGQSLDPFNSGNFYISNASAISTSFASSSTTTTTSSSTSSTISSSTSTSTSTSTNSSLSSTTSFTLSTSSPILAGQTSTSSTTTGGPTISATSNSQDVLKLGLGLGLGLGIPLLLLLIGLLVFAVRRGRREKEVSPVAQDMQYAANPAGYYANPTVYYKNAPQAQVQRHELHGQQREHELYGGQGVYEAPT